MRCVLVWARQGSRSTAALALGFALAPVTCHADWFTEHVLKRTHVTGYRNIGLHFESVRGDGEAYRQGNFGGLGGSRFTDLGYLNVEGRKVADVFNFDLSFQDSRFADPQNERLTLTVDKGNWAAALGDVPGSLINTNRFTSFSRRVRGVSAGYKTTRFQARALRSESKGEPRSITLQGNNTRGPYYLQSNQIVRGSERITVDGVEQRFGDDYTIDYNLGAVVFDGGGGNVRVISPTSTIVASYESFGFGGNSGTVEGAGMAYDIPGAGRVALTGVRQLSGATNRSSSRLESFQGFGPATTPYTLDFTPASGQPVSVRIDGVLQTAGVDFHFDPSNPSVFYVHRFVPSSSTVDVVYVPSVVNDRQGDRDVWSVDYSGKIGSSGSFSVAQAFGRLTNTTAPRSGQARSADLSYDWGKAKARAGFRAVDDDFVSVQTAGFNRNERAVDLALDFEPGPNARWEARYENSSVASTVATGVQRSRFTRTGLVHRLTPTGVGAPLSLSLDQTRSQTGGAETVMDTLALSTKVKRGPWATSLALGSSQATGASSATVRSLTANGRYTATGRLGLNYGASLSAVDANGQKGNGHSYSLGIDYRPSDRYRASLNFADSDSGGVTSVSGFAGGYGYGVGGNGFTSSPEITSTYSAANGRRVQLDLEARPSDASVLGASLYSLRSEGSVTSNSTTEGVNAFATWDANETFRFAGNAGTSRTSILGTGNQPVSTTLGLSVDGTLARRWSYSARGNALFSRGSGSFDQDSTSASGSLSYRLSPRQSVGFNVSSNRVTGYLPQDDTDWSLDYRYQVWETLALGLVYRSHQVVNRDPTVTSGAYSSSGLHLELSFTFGR